MCGSTLETSPVTLRSGPLRRIVQWLLIIIVNIVYSIWSLALQLGTGHERGRVWWEREVDLGASILISVIENHHMSVTCIADRDRSSVWALGLGRARCGGGHNR